MVGGASPRFVRSSALGPTRNFDIRNYAKADYTKALASEAERWDLWAGRAEVEVALARWELAAADYSKAIGARVIVRSCGLVAVSSKPSAATRPHRRSR